MRSRTWSPTAVGAARTMGANGASSPRHQLLADPGYNEPHTKSDAETRRVHCKVAPPRMSTWHPGLKRFKQRRKADASQWNKDTAGPVADREQKARESERPRVLQKERQRGFGANTGRAKGETDERRGVEPRYNAD